MEISLLEITTANYICNSELPLRFLRDRLLYFNFLLLWTYMQNIFWKRLCDTKVNEFFSHFQNMLVWLIRKSYAALQLGFLCWKYIDFPSSPTPFPHTPYAPIALTTEKLIPLSPIRSENYINKKHSNSPWKISCLRKCSFNGTKPMTVLVFTFLQV